MRDRADDIFDQVIARPAEEWDTFLDRACASSPSLRDEVRELLELHRAAMKLGESPTFHRAVRDAILDLAPPPREEPGSVIGRYRLLQQIGEGGFGAVFLAEQTEPVRRRVALKVIKPGMDTKEVVVRFEAERQALALMDHPNIAKVFDAGATPQGRPYFVMEFVPGVRLTEHCDRHRLTIPQRLELFAIVCDAVAHAHTKGVIHRDLKPSNILVGVRAPGVSAKDADIGTPKIIDFGIAKATQLRLTERTLFTLQGQLIGTPEYMSPEQAEMTAQDVDTRTDVYALGVILYELLTGAVPFDAQSLRAAGHAEMLRIIREAAPPRPSTKLTQPGEAAERVAADRRARLDDLARQLRSELEWIPLKALRKERSERYRSAQELADDVRNYLAGRPLLAGPESAAYRARKFVRRNKGSVAAVAAVFLALVLGLAGTMWQAAVARREAANAREAEGKQRALVQSEQAQRVEAERQRREAQRQQTIAEQQTEKIVHALKRVQAAKRAMLTAIRSGSIGVDQNNAAFSLLHFGDPETAEQLFREAIADSAGSPGMPLEILNMGLGLALSAQGKDEEAVCRLEETVCIPPHDKAVIVRVALAASMRVMGRTADADAQFEIARQLASASQEPLALLNVSLGQGTSLTRTGDLRNAEIHLRNALDTALSLDQDDAYKRHQLRLTVMAMVDLMASRASLSHDSLAKDAQRQWQKYLESIPLD